MSLMRSLLFHKDPIPSKIVLFFFFQAEDGIRDRNVTGVQTCALPISSTPGGKPPRGIDGVLREIGRQPEEPRGGFPPGVEVLDSNRIRMTSLKMDESSHCTRAMWRGIINKLFSVQVNPVAAVGAGAQAVVAIDRWDQFASPANGIIPSGNSGTGRDIVPFEIHACVHALQHRSS